MNKAPKRLTNETKIRIAMDYISSNESLVTVAARYDVSISTVQQAVRDFRAGKLKKEKVEA